MIKVANLKMSFRQHLLIMWYEIFIKSFLG